MAISFHLRHSRPQQREQVIPHTRESTTDKLIFMQECSLGMRDSLKEGYEGRKVSSRPLPYASLVVCRLFSSAFVIPAQPASGMFAPSLRVLRSTGSFPPVRSATGEKDRTSVRIWAIFNLVEQSQGHGFDSQGMHELIKCNTVTPDKKFQPNA